MKQEKTTEFNLSEKKYKHHNLYDGEDVKEFIRLDTALIWDYRYGNMTFNELLERRSKLAGDKLT
jgi:hypothetical protein